MTRKKNALPYREDRTEVWLDLARELHNGVLQALTGAALQLRVISQLIDVDPKAANERLQGVETLIGEEQRNLREWIRRLEPVAPPSIMISSELVARLEQLRQRAEWQWGIRVQLGAGDRGSVPRALGDEIYRIVQEALTNAGRHARANLVRVIVKFGDGEGRVRIIVADDGCGFPFRGRYDLDALAEKQIGPRSLRERVARLHGELVIISDLSGSQLEIRLPSDEPLPPAPRKLRAGQKNA